MTRLILADTGPLYALADPSDQFHARAAKELEAIGANGYSVAVAYPNLCEAYTLVLHRLSGDYARQWLTEIMDGTLPLHPEPVDFSAGVARLRRFADHPITLVDAVIASLAERLRLPVWSFDRHFRTMRVKVWQ
jgi:predicted nucleic acid-binding protein